MFYGYDLDVGFGRVVMNWTGCKWVESAADRLSGTPVVIDTRMDADGVVLNFDEGMSAEEIAEEFGVDHTKIYGVLEFAGRLRERTAA